MNARGLSQVVLMRLLVALGVCLGCCWSCGAAAQLTESGGAEAPEYRRSIEAALEEYGAQRFEESRALFLRAHALSANARTHRGLGFVAFELRQYPDCVQHLEAALASQVKPLTGELRSEAEAILGRALAFVDRLKIEANPASVEVTVDGLPRAELPHSSGLVILAIGEHKIELKAEGYRGEQRRVLVRGGEQRELRAALEKVSSGPVAVAAPEPRARSWYKSPWLWTAVGVVVVGAGTGTAIALTRDGDGKPYAGTSNQTLTGP